MYDLTDSILKIRGKTLSEIMESNNNYLMISKQNILETLLQLINEKKIIGRESIPIYIYLCQIKDCCNISRTTLEDININAGFNSKKTFPNIRAVLQCFYNLGWIVNIYDSKDEIITDIDSIKPSNLIKIQICDKIYKPDNSYISLNYNQFYSIIHSDFKGDKSNVMLTYLCICSHINMGSGNAYVCYDQMQKETGISRNGLESSIAFLKEKELLHVYCPGGYWINDSYFQHCCNNYSLEEFSEDDKNSIDLRGKEKHLLPENYNFTGLKRDQDTIDRQQKEFKEQRERNREEFRRKKQEEREQKQRNKDKAERIFDIKGEKENDIIEDAKDDRQSINSIDDINADVNEHLLSDDESELLPFVSVTGDSNSNTGGGITTPNQRVNKQLDITEIGVYSQDCQKIDYIAIMNFLKSAGTHLASYVMRLEQYHNPYKYNLHSSTTQIVIQGIYDLCVDNGWDLKRLKKELRIAD